MSTAAVTPDPTDEGVLHAEVEAGEVVIRCSATVAVQLSEAWAAHNVTNPSHPHWMNDVVELLVAGHRAAELPEPVMVPLRGVAS